MVMVIFVVLMLFWLFGGGYAANRGDRFDAPAFGSHTLIPWLCVAILGWVSFGSGLVANGTLR